MCKVVPLWLAEKVLSWRFVRTLLEGDGDAEARHARDLIARVGGQHAVFGHTHQYRQIPVRPKGADVSVYLNSGTWRPRVYETADQNGFRKVKEITYLVFYDDPTAAYETWNGTKWG